MKIIVGLGNPGPKYETTRHNLGFMAADAVAARCRVKLDGRAHKAVVGEGSFRNRKVLIAKPQTYMNLSGESVAGLIKGAGASPADLVVVHDDLDLPLGRIRIRKWGGDGGHNGLASVISSTGTDRFVRVRLGVGRPEKGLDPAEYVLTPFLQEEMGLVSEVVKRAAEAVLTIVREGVETAMNRFNKAPEKDITTGS